MKPYLNFLVISVSLLTANRLGAQTDVLTQHNDNGRTGANLSETQLTPAGIKGHFGKLVFRLVDGDVYAQPLIVTRVGVANHASPVDMAIVATEHNSVYAFDANDINPASATAQLWRTGPDVLGQHIESQDLYQAINRPACTDITTEIGITGTPVIEITKNSPPRQGVVFVTAKSKIGNQYVYKLFSLNLADGSKLGEATFAGQVHGSGIGSKGSGANATLTFVPLLELNRPALLLVGNTLFVAFGGHCDAGAFHGWVFAYDVSNPKAMKQVGLFCTTPNGTGSDTEGQAGVWMSGQGPAADDSGNIFFVTGNGTYNGTTDFGDSVLRVKLAAGAIQPQDWFTPQNQELLKENDTDLGASGAVLVPDSHLLVTGGKEGRIYLIDRNNMGKGVGMSLHSMQVTHAPDLRFDPKIFYNIHGTPVIWARDHEMYLYVMGEEDPLKQFKLVPDSGPGGAGWKFDSDTPFKTSRESAPYPNFPTGMFGQHRDTVWMPGGFLSLSANGKTDGTGILWVNMPFAANANRAVVRGVLRAFDASDVSTGELWDSETTGNDADKLGQFAKFCPPTVANGKVYVATFQEETIGEGNVHRKAAGGDQSALAIYGMK
jgi:hypothetical protein